MTRIVLPIGLGVIAVAASLLSGEAFALFAILAAMISVGAFLALLENRRESLRVVAQSGALGRCALYAVSTGVLISSVLMSTLLAISAA